jgi:thioesterase domain-containing protein
MAQNLLAVGATVQLILLDTAGPKFYKPGLLRFADHLAHFFSLAFREKGGYLRARFAKLKGRLTTMLWKLRHEKAPDHGKNVPATLKNVEMANYLAGERYRPQVYAGPVNLFRAKEQSVGTLNDPQLGWGDLVTALKVQDVPGDHSTMMKEPHVRLLAERLRACIRDALDRS